MLNLPLNFSKEDRLPDNYDEFYELVSGYNPSNSKYSSGFKVYLDKIVPIQNGSYTYFEDKTLVSEGLTLKEIYENLKEDSNFFVAVSYMYNTHSYSVFRDNNVSDIETSLSIVTEKSEEEVSLVKQKIIDLLNLIRKEEMVDIDVNDPYILKVILVFMQKFNNNIYGIVSIKDRGTYFDVIAKEKKEEGGDSNGVFNYNDLLATISKSELSEIK